MRIFLVKTFCELPQTAKFAKVFTYERLPLYGICCASADCSADYRSVPGVVQQVGEGGVVGDEDWQELGDHLLLGRVPLRRQGVGLLLRHHLALSLCVSVCVCVCVCVSVCVCVCVCVSVCV